MSELWTGVYGNFIRWHRNSSIWREPELKEDTFQLTNLINSYYSKYRYFTTLKIT